MHVEACMRKNPLHEYTFRNGDASVCHHVTYPWKHSDTLFQSVSRSIDHSTGGVSLGTQEIRQVVIVLLAWCLGAVT